MLYSLGTHALSSLEEAGITHEERVSEHATLVEFKKNLTFQEGRFDLGLL